MNTRIAAPVLGTVSLVALLVGGAGAAQARVMIDDGPRTVASQGGSLNRVEAAVRAAKQADAGTTTGVSPAEAQGARLQKLAEAQSTASQGVSFDRVEAVRAAKQADAGTTTGVSSAEAQGARLQKLAEEQAEADERLRQHQLEHGTSSDRNR